MFWPKEADSVFNNQVSYLGGAFKLLEHFLEAAVTGIFQQFWTAFEAAATIDYNLFGPFFGAAVTVV